jgi:hypothetical protein
VAGKASTTAFVILLAVIAAVGAGVGVLMARRGGMKVSGTVATDGTSIGTIWWAVNDCESGRAMEPSFFGVGLRGKDGFAMRVADTGDNARIWVYSQGGRQGALQLSKQNCARWDVLVDRAKGGSGHVRIACTAGGGTAKADVSFERCGM